MPMKVLCNGQKWTTVKNERRKKNTNGVIHHWPWANLKCYQFREGLTPLCFMLFSHRSRLDTRTFYSISSFQLYSTLIPSFLLTSTIRIGCIPLQESAQVFQRHGFGYKCRGLILLLPAANGSSNDNLFFFSSVSVDLVNVARDGFQHG